MAENAENTDVIINNVLEHFAKELQVELKKSALENKTTNTFALLKSVMTSVSGANLRVNFNDYGRFVDMGVGRGVPIGAKGSENFEKYRHDNGRLKYYGRKPVKWYSKTAYGMLGTLKASLYRDLADAVKADIKNILENK